MTPRRLLAASVLLVAGFAILHAAGLRAWTSAAVLTPPAGVPYPVAVAGAFVYAIAWLAAIAIAPTLALAAGLSFVARTITAVPTGDVPPARKALDS